MNGKALKIVKVFCLLLVFSLAACTASNNSINYEFAVVRRGNIERTVSASGRINPLTTVRVLPQMSGKVERVYVDFNDTVRRGDVLAELNTDMLRLRRDQQLATLEKARSNYELQLLNFNSQLALAERNLISEYELRTSRTNLDNLAADVSFAEANLRVIETEINQFAFITSPIDGIVLDRTINEGDTVSENTNSATASIFTLAENLNEMQIEATVGELDITSIHRGQAVRFTLESLPGRTFTGVVETLRLIPVMLNNVVSYTVFIRVENHDGSLLPGMTCNVDFIVERSENALIISNGALRYQPTSLSSERIEEMVFYASLENMNEEQRMVALNARSETVSVTANQSQAQPARAQASVNTGIAGMVTGGQMPRGGFNTGPMTVQGSPRAARTVTMRNLWFINEHGALEVIQVMTGIASGSSTELLVMDASTIEGRQFILRERI